MESITRKQQMRNHKQNRGSVLHTSLPVLSQTVMKGTAHGSLFNKTEKLTEAKNKPKFTMNSN